MTAVAVRPDILLAELDALDTEALLTRALTSGEFGQVAVVSSFGAESAVLLHLVARRDPATPVILVNTRKLFGETLRYADKLKGLLGLTDLRIVEPEPAALEAEDSQGDLWLRSPEACCHLRKVLPLARALEGVDTWISGRKRFQAETRRRLPKAEMADGRLKLNPLADWDKARLDAYFQAHGLPRHPLEADGFLSIGCFPCTDRVTPGEDIRAGRWRNQKKTECGIHLPGAPGAGRLPVR